GGEIVEGPGIEPGGAAGEHLDLQAAVLEVTAVEVGDLELPTSGGRQRPGTVDDGLVVEVEAGDGEVGAGHSRLLLEGDGAAVLHRLHDTVGGGVVDPVPEHGGAVDVLVAAQDRKSVGKGRG